MKPEGYRQRLSELLLELSEVKGLSGRELAKLADVSSTSIQAYMTAMAFPGKENREKIARGIFGISLEELDANIEQRPVQRQSKVDDVCREIRLMSNTEFLEVFQEVSRQVPQRFQSLVTES